MTNKTILKTWTTPSGETFKELEDYPQFAVSTRGNIFSIKTKTMLKPFTKKMTNEYLSVNLKDKEGHHKQMLVHRLVALAFIPNDDPTTKREINHKDENKQNNRVENLEWCTHYYNCHYGHAIEKAIATRKRIAEERGYWHSPETIAKMKANHAKDPEKWRQLGLKAYYGMSKEKRLETARKISEGLKAYYKRKREEES